jgi:predicted porin
MQMANRKGNEPIENVDLKMMQTTVGLRWEFSPDFELIGGIINQTNKGNDFSADRNGYTEVTYFQLNNYNLTQQITSVGLRYNFTPKIYLCALYQQSNYQDKKQNNANFKINQFGIIYNIIL